MVCASELSYTAMASSPTSLLLSVFTIFCLLFLASSSSSSSIKDHRPGTIVIPLTRTPKSKQSREPSEYLQRLASTSSPRLKTSLFPHSYGGHSITLSFGTPPQKLSFLVDTGSHVVAAPCTREYTCTNCSFSADKVRIFNPELSSSSKPLLCKSPKCVDTNFPDVPRGCPNCTNCSHACPPYTLQYASGASTGFFLSETLYFPHKTVHKFLLGCTTAAAREPLSDAIAGFGRTLFSFPTQMGVNKFAYCLNSHDYDDTRNSSKLVLDYNEGATKGLSYVPLLQNPPIAPIYFYLGVEDIMIGNRFLRIPREHLAPGSDARGGVIIDSGYAYGYMTIQVYKIVTNELKRQMSKYRRFYEGEDQTGYSPCYNFTGHKSIEIPNLVYQFTSGASMVVPAKNYFLLDDEMTFACFPLDTDGTKTLEVTPGPSVILGNSQQVNYYIEFDLKNERLGFQQQTC